MAICNRSGCDERAVGVVLTQGETYSNELGGQAENVQDHCRPHHVEERRAAGRVVACELLKNGVTIVDVDGTDKKRRGDRIEFDADEINVDQLVDAGLVKRLDAPSLAESLAGEEEALKQRLADVAARKKDAEKAAKAEEAEAEKAAKAQAKEAAKAPTADAAPGDRA